MRKEGFPAIVRGSRTSNRSTLSLSECIAVVVPNVGLERDHCLIPSESDSSPVIVSINENSSATSLTQPETQKQTVPLHKEVSNENLLDVWPAQERLSAGSLPDLGRHALERMKSKPDPNPLRRLASDSQIRTKLLRTVPMGDATIKSLNRWNSISDFRREGPLNCSRHVDASCIFRSESPPLRIKRPGPGFMPEATEATQNQEYGPASVSMTKVFKTWKPHPQSEHYKEAEQQSLSHLAEVLGSSSTVESLNVTQADDAPGASKGSKKRQKKTWYRWGWKRGNSKPNNDDRKHLCSLGNRPVNTR